MRKLALLVLLLLPLPAHAAEKPPEIASYIEAEEPVGTSKLRKLLLHVYDASFWSDSGGWKAAPYALTITYAMGFSPEELSERTRDEMKIVSSLTDNELDSFEQALRSIYPEVKAGDRITALALDAGTTVFYHNGKETGRVVQPDFGPAFFGIWLSEKSSEPDMQKELLAQN